MARVCCICNIEKDLELFYKNKSKPLGRSYECKECFKSITAERRRLNPDINRQSCRRYYQNNKESWYHNKENRAYHQANRRARKLKATPDWLSEYDLELIRWTYHAAKVAEKHYGELYHVDHIVPLQGKNVCGLHVPWNLRVIPARDNMSKGNRMPEEGLDPSQT